jgi:transposase
VSTKVHLAVDGQGRPLSIALSAGQRHECTRFEQLLVALPWPADRVVGDKGYSYTTVRAWLDERRIAHPIPTRSDQPEIPDFDRACYRRRNIVERCIGRLKQWRAIATRFDKRGRNYRAQLVLAAIMIWLPTLPTHPPDTP